jgi:hypothetical protein
MTRTSKLLATVLLAWGAFTVHQTSNSSCGFGCTTLGEKNG